MRAVVIDKPGEVQIDDAKGDPVPGVGEVVIEVGACGVCGTDLHIEAGEFPPTPYPIVPGHEFSGRVAAVGPDLPCRLEEGDRVAIDPSIFCGHCIPCRAGRGNLCENWNAIGDTVDGAFAQFVKVPAVNAYRMPDEMSYREGALVEPLSCAVHGLRRLGPVFGTSVLLVGAGTMGLLLQQLINEAGAAKVTVVDRNASRLPLAESLGAHVTATDVGDLDGERFDIAVDCTGVATAIEAQFDALGRGGRLLVFGVAPQEARARLSPFRIYNDEITVIGSMAVLNSYGDALDLMASGKVRVRPLLTHALRLEEFPKALNLVRHGDGVKVQVLPNQLD